MRAREFLSEESVNDPKYLGAVNQLLQTKGINLPLQPKIKGFPGIIDFYPDPGQQVTSLQDPITGKLANGDEYTFAVRKVYKSDAIKNLYGNKEEGTRNINKGELAEGYHATAAFARLIKRPVDPISVNDLTTIIPRLENGKTLVIKQNEADNKIADEFHLTISLKPAQWNAFKDLKTIPLMGKIIDSIVTDANVETGKFAARFANNQRFDMVRVIGDGVSEETTSKTDVKFENHAEKKFAGFSLKVDNKQVHQVGGGSTTAKLEDRFEILSHKLFNVDGHFPLANIDTAKEEFLKATSNEEAQKIAYKAAVTSLNINLQTDNREKAFLKNLIGAMKFWVGRTDPNIKVKQFTEKGTSILDPQKIDSLIDQNDLDLEAFYTEGKSHLPKITIRDNVSQKSLVSFRTKRESKTGYIRNYIEKEDLWVDLTVVKHIPNQPVDNPTPVATPIDTSTTAPKPTVATPATSVTPGIANAMKPLGASKIPMGTTPVTK